jgi:putative transposase
VIQLALENDDWGYGKIAGELEKLGIELSETAVGNILRAEGIEPAPVRAGSIGWKTLMRHYREQLLATDFFTVETILLKTVYVFFLIELGTRRVYLAGITQHPNGHWVTQQARNQVWLLQEKDTDYIGLIRDNDSKYTEAFDAVFESEGINIIRPPYPAPNANSVAERWVRTVRSECLDKLLILNEAHLRRVLNEFLAYYNTRRPHQGLAQQSPIERPKPGTKGLIQKRKVLGGIINDYFRLPAPKPQTA